MKPVRRRKEREGSGKGEEGEEKEEATVNRKLRANSRGHTGSQIS